MLVALIVLTWKFLNHSVFSLFSDLNITELDKKHSVFLKNWNVIINITFSITLIDQAFFYWNNLIKFIGVTT